MLSTMALLDSSFFSRPVRLPLTHGSRKATMSAGEFAAVSAGGSHI